MSYSIKQVLLIFKVQKYRCIITTTIIAHPDSGEQGKALKAVMKALKIPYKEKAEDQPYNPEFVAQINKSRQHAKEGKVTRLRKEDFKTYVSL